MHHRLPRYVASLVLVSLLGSACGKDSSANQSPVLTGPTTPATEVASSATIALTLEATDPEGDTLTYAWRQTPVTPAGTFSSATDASPTWTAPLVTVDTLFKLGVTVSDAHGGTTGGAVVVTVHPPPVNHAPTLPQAPAASPTSVVGAVPVQLSVTAADADGDTLTFAWTQEPASPAGTFSDAAARAPTWTAPTVTSTQRFTLKLTVSDGRGGTVQGQTPVDVAPPIPGNRAPVVTAGPSATATTLNEQLPTTLSVTATDADSDPLTYLWEQTAPASPTGTFSSTSVANPTWTAPDVTANGTYTLRVTISDGHGGSAQGSIDIAVQRVNQPPTVAASISGPTTLTAGTKDTFSITASDADGDPLTYAWSQTAPATQGTFVGGTTSASAQWYSPVVSTQTSFTFSVSVTDGQSTPVVRTVTIPVTVPHYTADIQSIWGSAAGCTGCHGTSGTLSLAAGSSYANLVNVTAKAALCSTLSRVTPGDPDNSVLVRKMEGTACGNRMPRNNPQYFVTNPELPVRVRSWILAGAAND